MRSLHVLGFEHVRFNGRDRAALKHSKLHRVNQLVDVGTVEWYAMVVFVRYGELDSSE